MLETNNGCCLDIKPVKCHAPATLLTGDGAVLQESNTQLEKYSDNDEISTKVMQIPHHGAKEEWSKTVGNLLSNRKYCFENYVVSYGFGNNYGHPTYYNENGIGFFPMPDLRCYFYSLSIVISNVNRAPNLKTYSKMAASASLIYSLQQSWNISNLSFYSSVKLFSKSL